VTGALEGRLQRRNNFVAEAAVGNLFIVDELGRIVDELVTGLGFPDPLAYY